IYSCNGGQIEINASPISLNQAGQSGGAFYIENSSFSYDGNGVKNILNKNSASSSGGLLYAGEDAEISLSYCEIKENTLTSSDSNSYGAGLYLASGSSCEIIKNAAIHSNTSSGTLYGPGIYIENDATLEIGNTEDNSNFYLDEIYIGKESGQEVNPILINGLPGKDSSFDEILIIDNSNLTDGEKVLKFQDQNLVTALALFTETIMGYYTVKDPNTNYGRLAFSYVTDDCVYATYKEGEDASTGSITPTNYNYAEYDIGSIDKTYISRSSSDLNLTLNIPEETYNVISSSNKSVTAVLYGPTGEIVQSVITGNISDTASDGYYPVVFQNLVNSSMEVGSYKLSCSAQAEGSANVIPTKTFTFVVIY
nr:hypothetical protein [Treponema sp.]